MSMHGRGLKNGLEDEQSKLSSNYLANKLIRGRTDKISGYFIVRMGENLRRTMECKLFLLG